MALVDDTSNSARFQALVSIDRNHPLHIHPSDTQGSVLKITHYGAYDDSSVSPNAKSYGTSTNNSSGTLTALMSDVVHSNWIIDIGASNHKVHSLSLMKHCTNLGDKSDMKVNLPTGAQVAISHVGDSLVLKDKLVKDFFTMKYSMDFTPRKSLRSRLRRNVNNSILCSKLRFDELNTFTLFPIREYELVIHAINSEIYFSVTTNSPKKNVRRKRVFLKKEKKEIGTGEREMGRGQQATVKGDEKNSDFRERGKRGREGLTLRLLGYGFCRVVGRDF
ncbi:hypothetical protein H5410_012005 [Solanum commersonii]|uniref:Uncharacterized protein n=1 Tax=Solanum commersonii TaxID=4109 RepID=A0A9J6AR79_SOLCO|nr:hypothetical protein H5410_012005 [Solanum commersonii]